MLVAVAAYAADVAILGTYALSVRTRRARPFHWANAIGAFPVAAVEISARAWPALILTATFSAIGWAGALRR